MHVPNIPVRKRAPSKAVETLSFGGGWFKEIRRRLSGKGAGQLYPIYTHHDGRTCSSKAQLVKLGGVDNSVDRRTLRKGAPKPKARRPKAKAKGKAKAKARDLEQPSIDSGEGLGSATDAGCNSHDSEAADE